MKRENRITGEKDPAERVIPFLILGGILLRIYYAAMVPARLYQNDLGWLEPDNYGHLGYVYYIFSHGRLPDLNPMEYYQFYHPPLHHLISAVFVKIYTVFGYNMNEAAEMLQMLSVLYSSLTLLFLNKIGIRLRIPAFGRAAALGAASFLPYGIMMGAGLNNDGLALLFVTMAVYFTLVWYEAPDCRSIAAMALCIGLAMMSKMSGALAAPAMAVLMLHRAWKDREHWRVYLKQFLVFGLIAFPLGLWHPLLQYARYGMPLGFVPLMTRESEMYVGMYGKWSRLFDFRDAFRNLSVVWDNSLGADYNIPAAMAKFAVFGEADYYRNNPAVHGTGVACFWLTFLLLAATAVSCFAWLFQKRNTAAQKASVGLLLAVHMFSYIVFCMRYPFVCTMNIRYVMAAVYFGFLVMGAVSAGVRERLAAGNGRAGKCFATVLSAGLGVYIALCAALILQMGQIV